ncbi:putative disease resistance protein-like isoform X2 [Capsicum annuum]|nr:putative disease resistance protein-like isoform X2 [Capsicum annuum]
MSNEPLFPRLEDLYLKDLPKLGHFILTKHAIVFSFLKEVDIRDCPEMKTFVQQGAVSTPSLEIVNDDDELKVVDLNKAMFNSKISCPGLEKLFINGAHSITALCSHQLPTAYFRKLEKLEVDRIKHCQSMEQVITEEEQQGEEIMNNELLFPLLEELELQNLPKLWHFFLTMRALEFPFLKKVKIDGCLERKMFVSCPNLEELSIYDANNITALCCHQLSTAYFSKLVTLKVQYCEKLRNLMSASVARGLLDFRKLWIKECQSMEEVITEEEQEGEEIMNNEPLFPLLKELELQNLPKLWHFFLTKRALEFPFLKKVTIDGCLERKMFAQQGAVSSPSLEVLYVITSDSITSPYSHQLPCYFSKLVALTVSKCGNWRNLMFPSVARGVLKLRELKIENSSLMEEVITAEEEEGEEMSNEPLFPLLEKLCLYELSKLGHFFWTKRAVEFPFLREVKIRKCPEMKTFVQQGSVSTPSLEIMNGDDEVKVDDLNEWIHQRFNSKEEDGSESEASQEEDGSESETSQEEDGCESEASWEEDGNLKLLVKKMEANLKIQSSDDRS